jgi:replicative DNA helicase
MGLGMSEEGYIPPNDTTVEQIVIGCVFLEPQLLADAWLRPEDFWREAHQHIWRAILAVVGELDWLAVVGEVRKAGKLEACGGEESLKAYLVQTSQDAVSAWGFERHVATVKDLAMKREVIKRATEVRAIALDDRRSADDAVADFSLSAERLLNDAVTTPDTSADEMMAELTNLYAHPPECITTTYAHLDMSGEFTLGSLNTISSRPGHGKSSLAANFAERLHKKNIPVGVCTLEMQRTQFSQLMLSIRANVSRTRHAKGTLTADELQRVIHAREELSSGWKLSDRPMTVEQIGALARKWQRKDGVRVVLVDHLQRIKRSDARQEEVAALGHITWSLAELARSTGLVIIMGAQLNREAEKDRGTVQQRHLKGSGSIEEDSAMVIQIKVDETSCQPNDSEWVMDLVKVKDRYGSLSRCPIRFFKTTGRMIEIDNRQAVVDQFTAKQRKAGA